MKRTLSILWGPFGFRADELAEAVGAERVSLRFLYGPRYFAPARYLALLMKTLVLLEKTRPQVVYAQNPPIFCPIACLLYSKVSGARLIIDHHSVWRLKTLSSGPISWVIGALETFAARLAYANTTPHSEWARELGKAGARRILVVHDSSPRNEYVRDDSLRRGFASEPFIAISSHGGHPLERLELEAKSVGKLKSVALLITGPREKLGARLSGATLPPNVQYLGFLDRDTYERLKASADFAINVTDEPHTLSHVLFEFAASSLPTISSKQAVVREVFGDSLIYVESSSEAIAAEAALLTTDKARLLSFRERLAAKFVELEKLGEVEREALRELFV